MAEVPLTFDTPSNNTVDTKGVKLILIENSGHEKTHYTIVLACCADGIKLPSLLIFKKQCIVIIFHKEFLSTFLPKDGLMKCYEAVARGNMVKVPRWPSEKANSFNV
jgi:hypothetical protein